MPDDLKYAQQAADYVQRDKQWAIEHNVPIPEEPTRPPVKLPRGHALPVLVHQVGLAPVAPAIGLEKYGDECLLTLALVTEHLCDRFGNVALLEWLDDESAQVERFGRVVVRSGRWPTDDDGKPLSKLVPGSEEWRVARSDAYQRARSGGYEVDRKAALAQVAQTWGPEYAPTASPQIFNSTYGLEGLSGRMS